MNLVFHVALLEKAPQDTRLAKLVKVDEDEFYEVEKILKYKGKGKRLRYLIKWMGYSDAENI